MNTKTETITIAIKEPGEAPVLKEIEYKLEAMQKVVGGYLEAVSFIPDLYPLAMWCNEDGRQLGLMLNLTHPALVGETVVGTVFVSGPGDDDGETLPLTKEQGEQALAWLNKYGVVYA